MWRTLCIRFAFIVLAIGAALIVCNLMPAQSNSVHEWQHKAEQKAQLALARMTTFCEARGESAQAWAEVNTTQPDGYEVISECVGSLGTSLVERTP